MRTLLVSLFLCAGCGSSSVDGSVDEPDPPELVDTGTVAKDTAEPVDTGSYDWETGDWDTGAPEPPADSTPEPPSDTASSGEPSTTLVNRGALLFSDNFSSGSYKPNWQQVGGTWSVVDGVLTGSQPAGDADPNLGKSLAVDRAVIQFDFKFTGTGRPGIRLNHKDSTLSEHLVNLSITGSLVKLSEMTGWSSTTTSKQLATKDPGLVAGKWYTAVFEIYDTQIAFSIDGKPMLTATTSVQNPRNHMVIQAYGDSVAYDNVKIWSATKK